MKIKKFEIDKELFSQYNIIGKALFIFSHITGIRIKFREIYLKK